MKKLLLLAGLIPSMAYSQSSLMPVECGTLKQLSEVLVEYDEKPLAIANTTRNASGIVKEFTVLFFLNEKTKTWTVAEKVRDDLYCVISTGKNFNFVKQNI